MSRELPRPESMNGYADSCSDPGLTGFTEPDHYSAPAAWAEFRKEYPRDPVGAPYIPGSETSKEAARRIVPHIPTDEERILTALRERPDTCDGLEERLDLKHQTASARIRGLVKKRRITKTIRTALTRSQRRAFVYEVCG